MHNMSNSIHLLAEGRCIGLYGRELSMCSEMKNSAFLSLLKYTKLSDTCILQIVANKEKKLTVSNFSESESKIPTLMTFLDPRIRPGLKFLDSMLSFAVEDNKQNSMEGSISITLTL